MTAEQSILDQGFRRFNHRLAVPYEGRTLTISHPVFCAGQGPALLVMHELPGLEQSCVNFGKRLIAQGFSGLHAAAHRATHACAGRPQ